MTKLVLTDSETLILFFRTQSVNKEANSSEEKDDLKDDDTVSNSDTVLSVKNVENSLFLTETTMWYISILVGFSAFYIRTIFKNLKTSIQ